MQSLKTHSPIEVTLLGIVTEVNSSQPPKALSSIEVILKVLLL